MATRALLCAAAVALLFVSPALATPLACPAPLQQWQCDKCNVITNPTYRTKCLTLTAAGYNPDAIVPCATQVESGSETRLRDGCLDNCIAKLPVGQEWRCTKCLPNSVKDKPFCFDNEGRNKIDSDAVVACASLALPNFFGQAGWRCNDCLVNIAYLQNRLGQYNDWRCLKCADPALLANTADANAARDACYSLVSGVDAVNRDNARPTLVTQADDVLSCSKATDATVRGKCYNCLTSRTASNDGTWPCMSALNKATTAAKIAAFDCLLDLTKTWQC